MELELKHIASYLPYGLKLQYVVREKVEQTGIMKSISHNEDETNPTRVSIYAMYNEEHIWMFKPLLRPLSQLTKEIEHNGEKFIPYKKLGWEFINGNSEFGQLVYCEYGETPKTAVNVLDYLKDLEKLLEWHFDIHGLIENNLAIEIK